MLARLARVLRAARRAWRNPSEPDAPTQQDVYVSTQDSEDLEGVDEPLSFEVYDLYRDFRRGGYTPAQAVRQVAALEDLPDAEIRRLIDEERQRTTGEE